MSFSVKANFIDVFKIGDNINYNLEVLKILYDGYSKLPEGNKLIKPIVIINTAIAEATQLSNIKISLFDLNRNKGYAISSSHKQSAIII